MTTEVLNPRTPPQGKPQTALVLALGMLAGMADVTEGAVRTWTGGSLVGSYWSYTDNWKGGLTPKDGDEVEFPASASRLVNTNSIAGLDLASITFSGSGYTVRGNAITLSKGIAATASGSVNRLETAVMLRAGQSIQCTEKTSTLYVNGNLNLQSYTLATDGAGAVRLGGVISGTGDLTKNGTGTHRLEGASANTYTGTTRVNSGTLMLAKSAGNAVPSGALTVGDGLGSANSTIVRELADFQIGSIPITLNADGWLDMGNYYDTVGAITFNGGRAGGSATGTLALGGTVTVNASAKEATLAGHLALNTTSRTFNVQDGTAVNDLNVSAVIDNGGFVKTGPGVMVLTASNTFDGEIVINQGTLRAENDGAFGSALGGTTVTGTGELVLISTYVLSDEALTLDKPDSSGNALSSSYSTYWTGPVTLADQVGISASGPALNLTGVISGPGGVSLNGPGIYRFSGSSPNTYTGDTYVNNGTLELSTSGGLAIPHGTLTVGDGVGPRDEVAVQEDSNHQLGDGVSVTINVDGWLSINSHTDTVGALTFNGGHAGSTTGTLRLNGSVTVNASASEALLDGNVFMGTGARKFNVADGPATDDLRVTAVLSGGGLTKTGSGRMALLENNTYSGDTLVSQGSLYGERDSSFGSTAGGTTVTGSGTLYVFNADIPNEPLTLDKPDSSGDALVTSGSTLWLGPVTLAGQVGISIEGSLDLAGTIGGAGGLSLNGPGTLLMSGSSANTYAGDTRVKQGTLRLNKTPLDGALPGPGDLYVGDGVSAAESITVQWLHDSQLDEDVTIHVIPGGKIDLNNQIETVGDVVMEAGRIDTGTGTLTSIGDVTAQSVVGMGRSEIHGRFRLESGARTFTVPNVNGASWPGLLVDADVSGPGGILKAGAGALGLRGNNSYSGKTTVSEGTLLVLSDAALGSTSAGTTVQSGTTLQLAGIYATDIHVGDEALTLSGYLAAGGSGFSTSDSWAGAITLAADSVITVYPNVVLNLAGVIDGPGGFTKTREGTLILSGPDNNLYKGPTWVKDGSLLMDKLLLKQAINAGSLTVGDDVDAPGSAVAKELESHQLGNIIPVTVNSDGLLDLDNHDDAIGFNLTLNDGRVQTGTGRLHLQGDGRVTASGLSCRISGQLDVGAGDYCVVDVLSGALSIPASLEGSANIYKIGAGVLHLEGSNSFTGILSVDEHIVTIQDSWALGSANAGTTIKNAARLIIRNNLAVESEPLFLNSTSGSALWTDGGTNSWAGPVTLSSDASIRIDTNAVLEISGPINGGGSLTKTSDGTLILSGTSTNSYAGETLVREGTLVVAKSGNGPAVPGDLLIGDDLGGTDADVVKLGQNAQIATGRVTLADSGLLDLDGWTGALGSLSGSGRADIRNGILVVGEDNSSTSYAGTIEGTGGLIKRGTGTLTLTGNSPYPPATRVDEGILLVNGSLPASVQVEPLTKLGGTGAVGIIVSDGTVAPGTSPGKLSAGSTTLHDGSTFSVELNGFMAGVDYDQLNLLGTVSLGDATLDVQLACPVAAGDEFVIVNNDGADAITGTFAGLPNGSSLTASNATLRIDYDGGTGNDVVLTVTGVTPVEDLRITTVAATGGELELGWRGGVPFYVVEKKTSMTNDMWQAVTPPTRETQTRVPMNTPAGFYRVTGGN